MTLSLCADTHCHLDDPKFSADLTEVIARAAAAGIHPIVAPAEDLESSRRILAIARAEPAVRPCVGVHPHRAAGFDESQIPEFEAMAGQPATVAIGEIGLDYYYEQSPRAKQLDTLTFFLDLAARTKKPACLHVRDKSGEAATEDMLNHVRAWGGRVKGVIHCFTGTREQARDFLDLGFFLSFTGIITFSSAGPLRDVVAGLPHDRILLETDAPYLAPMPYRGKRNEPAFLERIFGATAAALGLGHDEWSDRLRRNERAFFDFD